MQAVGGTFIFKIDGQQISVGGAVKYQLADEERTAMVGADKKVDYVIKPIDPNIELEIKDSALTDLVALHKVTNVTITGELANGRTLVMRNAVRVGTPQIDAINGTGTFNFSCEEMRFI